jgi:predicted naringenin-chalcone synthase
MFVIDGLGTATPRHRITQDDAADIAQRLYPVYLDASDDQSGSRVHSLYVKAGVTTRHSVLLHSSTNGESARQDFYLQANSANDCGPTTDARMRRYKAEAGPLVVQAARSALQSAEIDVRQVTHLITASCSGFAAPGVEFTLIRELGLSSATQRTHLGFMGCHAMINALRVAQAFAAADSQACVLIGAVELCSLHHQYGDRTDQIVANALFADGAAAIVGRHAGTEVASNRWRVKATGSTVIDEAADCLSWHIRDHGFEMSLSPRVPIIIKQKLKPWLSSWLGQYDLTPSDIESWAIHPGGPRILQACGSALDLRPDALRYSERVLECYGNMSSPTIVFILDELTKANAQGPCVLLAFGPGLAIEAALLIRA